MSIIQSIILGIVEGVTEFLPISSTGHLILTAKLFGIEEENFTKTFEIAIQFGAMLAVLVIYWRKIFSQKDVMKKVLIAFLPTAAFGFLFYRVLKDILLESSTIVVWSLLLGGIFLILFEFWHAKRDLSSHADHISYKNAFFIGIIQALAIIPGVSRAGATIIGGLFMGITRKAIVEFSFLLAVPTMAAATAYDIYKSAGSFAFGELHILAIGFIVSFIVAILAINWLLRFIQQHTFIPFGVYRIVVAVLFWIVIMR